VADSRNSCYVALSGSAPFKGLDVPVIDTIEKGGLVLEAKAGDIVYYEAMRGGLGLYLVMEGEIEILRGAATAGERQLAKLEPGQCFGEFSLIDGQDSSASARALTQVKLFFFPRARFQQLIESDVNVARLVYHNLLKLLIQRLRATSTAAAALSPA
jgi:CRP-like cAMP-binding protein